MAADARKPVISWGKRKEVPRVGIRKQKAGIGTYQWYYGLGWQVMVDSDGGVLGVNVLKRSRDLRF